MDAPWANDLAASPWLLPALFALVVGDAFLVILPSETAVVALGALFATTGSPPLLAVLPIAALAQSRVFARLCTGALLYSCLPPDTFRLPELPSTSQPAPGASRSHTIYRSPPSPPPRTPVPNPPSAPPTALPRRGREVGLLQRGHRRTRRRSTAGESAARGSDIYPRHDRARYRRRQNHCEDGHAPRRIHDDRGVHGDRNIPRSRSHGLAEIAGAKTPRARRYAHPCRVPASTRRRGIQPKGMSTFVGCQTPRKPWRVSDATRDAQ